jgi:hypothetical protein
MRKRKAVDSGMAGNALDIKSPFNSKAHSDSKMSSIDQTIAWHNSADAGSREDGLDGENEGE